MKAGQQYLLTTTRVDRKKRVYGAAEWLTGEELEAAYFPPTPSYIGPQDFQHAPATVAATEAGPALAELAIDAAAFDDPDGQGGRKLRQSARSGYQLLSQDQAATAPNTFIGRFTFSDAGGNYDCTAQFISPLDILTAAHCFNTAFSTQTFRPAQYGNNYIGGTYQIEWGDKMTLYTESSLDTVNAYWDMAIYRVTKAGPGWFSLEVPGSGSSCRFKEPIISCGYPGEPNNGYPSCSQCTMPVATDFCDTRRDVVNTATPCYTAPGHSGGAIRFRSSPLVVRGTLSRGNDTWDLWAPYDKAHNAFFFNPGGPRTNRVYRTVWASTYAFTVSKKQIKNAGSTTTCLAASQSATTGSYSLIATSCTNPPDNAYLTWNKPSTTSLQLQLQVANGQIICLALRSLTSTILTLAPCANVNSQWFIQDSRFRIRPAASANRCLNPSTRTGRVTLTACSRLTTRSTGSQGSQTGLSQQWTV